MISRLSRRFGMALLALAAMGGAAVGAIAVLQCLACRTREPAGPARRRSARGAGGAARRRPALAGRPASIAPWAASAAASCSSASSRRRNAAACGRRSASCSPSMPACSSRRRAARRAAPRPARGGDQHTSAVAQQRGFFETIFGIEPRRGEIDSTMPELDPEQPLEPEAPPGRPLHGLRPELRRLLLPARQQSGRTRRRRRDVPGALPGLGDDRLRHDQWRRHPERRRPLDRPALFVAAERRKIHAQLRRRLHLPGPGPELVAGAEGRPSTCSTSARATSSSPSSARPSFRGPRPIRSSAAATPKRRAGAGRGSRPMPPTRSRCPPRTRRLRAPNRRASGPSTVGEKIRDKGDGVKSETRSVTGERRTVRIVAPNLAPNLGPSSVQP